MVRVWRAVSIAHFEFSVQRSDLLFEFTIRGLEAFDFLTRRDQLCTRALRFASKLLRFTDGQLMGTLRLGARGGCLPQLPLRRCQLTVQALSFCAGTLEGLLHFGPGLLDAGLRGFARAIREGETFLELGSLPVRPGQLRIQASRLLGRHIAGVGELGNLRLGTLARTLKFDEAAVHLFQFTGQALVFLPEQLGLGAAFGHAFRRAEQLLELGSGRFQNLVELGQRHLLVCLRLLFCVRLLAGYCRFGGLCRLHEQEPRPRLHLDLRQGARLACAEHKEAQDRKRAQTWSPRPWRSRGRIDHDH